MRCFLSIAAAMAAAGSIGITAPSAEARDYPFCIKGANYVSSVGDCSFDTYQQCLDTASGRYAFCDRNPYFTQTGKPYVAKRKTRGGQQ
jgi:hypothetical protein